MSKQSIQSAAVIGAGALGLLYAESLYEKLGENFFFIADGDRAERLKNTEFSINRIPALFPVRKSDDPGPKPDLIILAVKNHNLEEIRPLLKNMVQEGTILVSVLNGIDSEEFLADNFPRAEIIYTLALGMDAVKEGNRLSYTGRGKLLMGRRENNPDDPILKRTADFFSSAGVNIEIPEDIHRSLWWKWMINIGVNQVSAVTGAPYGVFQKESKARALMDSAMRETVAVARAAGINLTEKDIYQWYKVLATLGPEGKTSMLQDMEAHRPTEAPWFSGKLISLAEEYGIAAPVNRTLYQIIQTRESLY